MNHFRQNELFVFVIVCLFVEISSDWSTWFMKIILLGLSMVRIRLLSKPQLRPGWHKDSWDKCTVYKCTGDLVYSTSVQPYKCSKQSVCARTRVLSDQLRVFQSRSPTGFFFCPFE